MWTIRKRATRWKGPRCPLSQLLGASLLGLLILRWGTDQKKFRLPPAGVPIRVVRVIDGDTVQLADGIRVRLLGVNTPETKHPARPAEPFGEEAYEFLRSELEGHSVKLEYDRERRDDYRRTLAYIRNEAGELMNLRLVENGYSRAITSFPLRNDRVRLLKRAEEHARSRSLNIWSAVETSVNR